MGKPHWIDDLPDRLHRWADLPDSTPRRRRLVGHLIDLAESIAADAPRSGHDQANLRTACCFACGGDHRSPCLDRGACPLDLHRPADRRALP